MAAGLVERLLSSVQRLAAPAEEQLRYVRELGVGNDEIALEFDDVAGTRRTLVIDGMLSEEQAEAIAAIDVQLRRISSAGAVRWTDEAMRTGEDWAALRSAAQSALAVMSGD